MLKTAQKRTLKCEKILVYTGLSPDNSPQLYKLGGRGCTKASNKLTQPCCRLCFEALASVLLNQRCQKPPPSNPGPSNSRAWLPTHRLSPCGAFPVWSHAGSCLSPCLHQPLSSGELHLDRANTTSSSEPSCADTKGSLGCGLPYLTLAPSLRSQLSPEILGNTDPVCR